MNLKQNMAALSMGLFFVASIVGCKKPNFDKIATDAWSTTVAVPVASATYTMSELLDGKDSLGFIETDADGAISLVYSIDQELANASDFLELPSTSQTFSESAGDYGVPAYPFFSGTENVSIDEEVDLSAPAGFKLFNIDFLDGTLILEASTTLMHDVEFVFSFPDLLENGVPATRTINLPYQVGQPSEGVDSIDLGVSVMDLTAGSAGFNQFRVQAEVTINGTGNPLTGAESLDFGMHINNPEFDLITGDFGQQSIFGLKDTTEISLFDNYEGGTFVFTNPQINFSFTNSFGVPIGLDFNEIKAIEEGTGNQFVLTGIPSNFVINAPAAPSLSVTSTLGLNNGNTNNIGHILTPSPKSLVLDVGGEVNPAGPATNFVSSSSTLSTNIEMIMPLEGYASGFGISDTQSVTLDLPDFLEFAEFRILTDNGFPFEIQVDLMLLDENDDELFSLTDGLATLVAGAPVDANGRVTESIENILDLRVENEDLPDLRAAQKVVVRAVMRTTDALNQTNVKLYDDYEFSLSLGLKGQANVNPF